MSKVHVCVCARISSDSVDYPIIISPEYDTIEIQHPFTQQSTLFQLHNLIPSDVSQAETFDLTVRPLLDYTLRGNNTAIFLYGSSKSGKTYTAIGGEYPNIRGILPRIISTILEDVRSQNPQYEIKVSLSIFELFNDQVRDLAMVMSDTQAREKYFGQNLLIEERAGVSYVKELTEVQIEDTEYALQVIRQSLDFRRWLEHDRGQFEPRCHTFYRIKISSRGKDESDSVAGSNNFWVVDLARNEKNHDMTGKELQESLSASEHVKVLGKIIKQLRKTSRLNLKESKLTHILQECFSDGGCVELFVTINPLSNIDLTINTLKFAQDCMPLNKVSKLISRNRNTNGNFSITEEKIRKLQEERMELKLELASIEATQQSQFSHLLDMFGIPGDIDSIFQNGPYSQSMKQIARQLAALEQIKVELQREEELEKKLEESRETLNKYRRHVYDTEEKHIANIIQTRDALTQYRQELNEKKYNLDFKISQREKHINTELINFISHTSKLIQTKQTIIQSLPINFKSVSVSQGKLNTLKSQGTNEAKLGYEKELTIRANNIQRNFKDVTEQYTQRTHLKDQEIQKAKELRAKQKADKK
jgi:hypothetical protein